MGCSAVISLDKSALVTASFLPESLKIDVEVRDCKSVHYEKILTANIS